MLQLLGRVIDLHQVNILSVIIRMILAMTFGGLLGIERGKKKRAAGFRTYMVVCLGATLAMLTNQYIAQVYGTQDPSRIAAQVISGIGFLGAGTIIVTGHSQVRGLTTAAGLWATASLGLAVGIGFYEGAILGFAALFIAMNMLGAISRFVSENSRFMLLYVEFRGIGEVSKFIEHIKTLDMYVSDIEITKKKGDKTSPVSAMVTVGTRGKIEHAQVMETLSLLEGVSYIEEIHQ